MIHAAKWLSSLPQSEQQTCLMQKNTTFYFILAECNRKARSDLRFNDDMQAKASQRVEESSLKSAKAADVPLGNGYGVGTCRA